MSRIQEFFQQFKIQDELENISEVRKDVLEGINFTGTNLWILIFAILIACLGLNVNSTAVVIGAMLISPLMGPIVGMGFSLGMYDFALLKKSFYNFLVMTLVSLLASTIFFFITPIHQAYSEILSRTSPTLFDVLIALTGGFAGVFALFSTKKGNVIPGVAIATALMPPLCTAGYGLANGHFSYFGGALFLYTINSVFIGLANYAFVSYYARTHRSELADEKIQKQIRFWLTVVVLLMVIPSVIFAVRMVNQERFSSTANEFINKEVESNPNYFLADKDIDPGKETITLTYRGKTVDSGYIKSLDHKLHEYYDADATLVVRQGVDWQEQRDKETNMLMSSKNELEQQLQQLKYQVDSLSVVDSRKRKLIANITALDSNITEVYINRDLSKSAEYEVFIKSKLGRKSNSLDLDNYLRQNLDSADVNVYYLK